MLRASDLDKILADELAGSDDPVVDNEDDGPEQEKPAQINRPAQESPVLKHMPGSQEPSAETETPLILHDGGVEMLYIKRGQRSARLTEGCTVGYRCQDGEPLLETTFGGRSMPWALEVVLRRGLAIGEQVNVTGRGEFAFADCEEMVHGEDRHWQFELISVGSDGRDKFQMRAHQRIERATELREWGNAMMKKGRLLRAADHYERGSSLMDVIEAEELDAMPGTRKDETAANTNKCIRSCQQPLLLNWSLVLMKQGKYAEAERKCTEVLLDIDQACVKALFRRGQCHVELGNLQEARVDLQHAQELDQTVAAEVARELAKLGRRQKAQDAKDKGWAKKALRGALGDSRSEAPPKVASLPISAPRAEDENEGLDVRIKESSAARLHSSNETSLSAAGADLMSVLQAQDRKASEENLDELTWCRQREAIYNQFMHRPPEHAED
jgi:tetratricopeptide (TPR) repeat protein